jgi:hypothetical protein
MAATVNSDHFKVTPDEALECMAHHLRLAALFYEMVPDERLTRVELTRLLRKHSGDIPDLSEPVVAAGLAFYDNIDAAYEKMKEND